MSELTSQVKKISQLLPKIARNLRVAPLIDEVKPGLTPSQLMVLLILKGTEATPLPVGRLAQELAVSFPTISGVVDRLCREKLVERIASKDDRRLVLLRLSKEGKKVVDRLQKALEDLLQSVLEKMTEAEQKAITKATETVFEFSLVLSKDVSKNVQKKKIASQASLA